MWFDGALSPIGAVGGASWEGDSVLSSLPDLGCLLVLTLADIGARGYASGYLCVPKKFAMRIRQALPLQAEESQKIFYGDVLRMPVGERAPNRYWEGVARELHHG